MTSDPLVALEWATAELPLPRPLQAGALTIRSRAYCCVRATLASGATGEAFAMTRGLDVDGALETLVAPLALAGRELRAGLRNVGWDGPISRAASAVRLAALDAEARAAAVPVWRLLGAEQAPSAAALAIVGYLAPGEQPGAGDVREASAAIDAGAAGVKLMGGAGGPADDLERVARVRDAIGDGPALVLDVNGAWSPADARAALPRLAAAGVTVVEEPFAYELGLSAFDALPDERPQLAFGEISASVVELEALLGTGAVDHLRPDATLFGGAEAWRSLGPALAASGASVFPHFWPELHRHLIALAPRVSYLECLLPGNDAFALDGLVTPSAHIADGRIAADASPGFGFALDWERVRRHAGAPPRRCGA